MAELLVMQADFTSADPAADAVLPKRGDVVVACPDGWPWSQAERTDPRWHVYAFPQVALQDALSLSAPGSVAADSGLLAPNRYFGLDLANAVFSADPATVTTAQLIAARFTRQPAPDPNRIGTDPTVIG